MEKEKEKKKKGKRKEKEEKEKKGKKRNPISLFTEKALTCIKSLTVSDSLEMLRSTACCYFVQDKFVNLLGQRLHTVVSFSLHF